MKKTNAKNVIILNEKFGDCMENKKMLEKEERRKRHREILHVVVIIILFFLFAFIDFTIFHRLGVNEDGSIIGRLEFKIPEIIKVIIYISRGLMWLLGLLVLSEIFEWMQRREKKEVINNVRLKFADFSDYELKETQLGFPPNEKCREMKNNVYEVELEIERRKRERRFNYFVNNIMIWILIGSVFFCYGYACAK